MIDALAADLLCALDPGRIMRVAGLPPDPWQVRLLEGSARQSLLLCCRQAGKSTVTAALALREALFNPPALVLLLAPAHRQSKELFKKVTDLNRALGKPVAAIKDNTLELELANGSRVVCLPGQEETIRGYSGVRLLIVDEAARVKDPLYFSVRPMLAVSGGSIVGLSTPFGRRGWFYHAWENGGTAWERVKVTAEQCPRISAEFLAEERRSLGSWWATQEYDCQFVDTLDQWFASTDVLAALSADVQPLWGAPC